MVLVKFHLFFFLALQSSNTSWVSALTFRDTPTSPKISSEWISSIHLIFATFHCRNTAKRVIKIRCQFSSKNAWIQSILLTFWHISIVHSRDILLRPPIRNGLINIHDALVMVQIANHLLLHSLSAPSPKEKRCLTRFNNAFLEMESHKNRPQTLDSWVAWSNSGVLLVFTCRWTRVPGKCVNVVFGRHVSNSELKQMLFNRLKNRWNFKDWMALKHFQSQKSDQNLVFAIRTWQRMQN